MDEMDLTNQDMSRVYKIKYCINLLPIVGEHVIEVEDENGVMKWEMVNDGDSLM